MSDLDIASNPPPSARSEGPVASQTMSVQGQVTGSDVDVTDDQMTEPIAADSKLTETVDNDDIARMKAEVQEMEEAAAKLREQEQRLAEQSHQLGDQQADVDARSIFVNNVDYAATPEELQKHFSSCGNILRVTILLDKFTGQPKGHAYVEFAQPSDVASALALNESVFRSRNLKVSPKRTNIPGFHRGRGRGRGGRGPFRSRGRGYRGGRGDRSSEGFSPY